VENQYNDTSGITSANNAFVAKVEKSSLGDQVIVDISKSDGSIFSDEQIRDFVNIILSNGLKSGSVNNIYYKIESIPFYDIIIATDVSNILHDFRINVLNALSIHIVVYLILSVIAVILSFNVFKPIKDSFLKQKQFISNASHELKTPLTIISANAEIIKSTSDSQWIDNINSQTERMNLLVNDLLTLAKIDEQKTPISLLEFNLSEVIINDTLPFDAVAYEKGKNLILDVQENIQYKGDLQSVKNIVNILLDNAIKHAEKGGEIIVTLKKENNKISLTIFNTGSNVPDNQASKVFERFYRADQSRSRESGGGSGLGLSIAKGIADNNKWKISAVSKLNQYMSITVIF
jgi:signal transduction histidine kinase